MISFTVITAGLTFCIVLIVASISLSVTLAVTTSSLRSFGLLHSKTVAAATLIDLVKIFDSTSRTSRQVANATQTSFGANLTATKLSLQRGVDTTLGGLFSLGVGDSNVGLMTRDQGRVASRFWDLPNTFASETFSVCLDSANGCMKTHAYNGTTMTPFPADNALNQVTDFANASTTLSTAWNQLEWVTLEGTIALWAGAFIFPSATVGAEPVYLMTLFSGMRDTHGQLSGFVSCAKSIQPISSFLVEHQEHHGASFVIDQSGYMIGSSMKPSFIDYTYQVAVNNNTPVGEGCDVFLSDWGFPTDRPKLVSCRRRVASYPFSPLRQLTSDRSYDPTMSSVRLLMNAEDDENWYAVTEPIAVTKAVNLHLTLIVLQPESEVLGNLGASRDQAIIVTAVVAIALVVLCVALTHALLTPLRSVAAKLKVVDSLSRSATSDDGNSPSQPHVYDAAGKEQQSCRFEGSELSTLLLAYRAMSTELERIRAFIPRDVEMPPSPSDLLASPLAQLEDSCSPLHAPMSPIAGTVTGRQLAPLTIDNEEFNNSHGAATLTSSLASQNRKRRHASVQFSPQRALSSELRPARLAVWMCTVHGLYKRPEVNDAPLAALLEARYDQAVRRIADVIQRFGGTLQRFHGDECTAIFTDAANGVIPVHGAVNAGLALCERRAASHDKELPLTFSLAVDAGYVLAGAAGCEGATSFNVVGRIVTSTAALLALATGLRRRTVLVPMRLAATINDRFRVQSVLDGFAAEVRPDDSADDYFCDARTLIEQDLELSNVPALQSLFERGGHRGLTVSDLEAVLTRAGCISRRSSDVAIAPPNALVTTASLGTYWDTTTASIFRGGKTTES